MANNRSIPPVSIPVARPAISPRGGPQSQTARVMPTSAFGTRIGRPAQSHSMVGTVKRSVPPPPVVSSICQPPKDKNVANHTVRNSVNKQDTALQPRSASGRAFVPGTRPAAPRSVGLVAKKRPTPIPQPTGRDVITTRNVLAVKSSVKELPHVQGYIVL